MPIARPNDTQGMDRSPSVKRSRGEDAVPSPGHKQNAVPADYRSINGWGVDLDPANRPSFPRELPSSVENVRGTVTARQVPQHRVHMSNEHPDLTPTFGTSVPARGLSGWLRDYAYEYGEATNRHWMTLMIADRVDIFESMISDALRGRPDNIFAEKGWKANVKYSPRDQKTKTLIFGSAVVAAIGVGLLLANRKSE